MASEFTVRSDSVDVEQIMGRIRARIGEKRGVDYTENEIRELANVTIEKFLDPTRVRSDLLEYYLKSRQAAESGAAPAGSPSGTLVGGLRRIFSPLLKPFAKLSSIRHAVRELRLNFVLIHNLVIELTRLAIEVRNLKMRVESLSSRLDFNERRARALENAVQYRPGSGPAAGGDADRSAGTSQPSRAAGTSPQPSRTVPASQPSPQQPRRDNDAGDGSAKAEAQRRRRRRRRGRGGAVGPGQTLFEGGGPETAEGSAPAATNNATEPAQSTSAIPDRDTTGQ